MSADGSTVPPTGEGLASETTDSAGCSLIERCSCREGSEGDAVAEELEASATDSPRGAGKAAPLGIWSTDVTVGPVLADRDVLGGEVNSAPPCWPDAERAAGGVGATGGKGSAANTAVCEGGTTEGDTAGGGEASGSTTVSAMAARSVASSVSTAKRF